MFPDGRPLDKKVYPWLLSGLVRAHFKRLQEERTRLTRLENLTVVFLAWWIVPLTVLIFWGRYLPRHEWIGTGLHIALLTISIGSAILLHRHAVRTLRRDITAFHWRNCWRDGRTYQVAVALGFGAVFALVSLGAIEGKADRDRGGSVALGGVATWVPYAFDRAGYRTFANLQETDLSNKPATWTGLAELPAEELDDSAQEKARAELAQVKGASLRNANLSYANAPFAFLAKARLSRANLQGANLAFANLQEANLTSANLQGANLWNANLQGADLFRANLEGAKLSRADLEGARLSRANLQEADLAYANLQGAKLGGANLQGAKLWGATGVTQEQLDVACGNENTELPEGLTIKPCE